MKKFKAYRIIMLFWTLFIGVGALVGTGMFLIDPNGNSAFCKGILEVLHNKMPLGDVLFTNLYFAAFSLFIVNGVSNILAAILIFMEKRIGYILAFVFGITLMLWITIQFFLFPVNYMDIIYFIFGALQFICGLRCYVIYMEQRTINDFKVEDYSKIDSHSKTIVVYYSRLGRVKEQAYKYANENGFDICEIETKERTKDTLGFWWCGRFGMHQWAMNVEPMAKNIKDYDKVVIFSPVWVFQVCGPVKGFVKQYQKDIKHYEIHLFHFMRAKFKKELSKLEKELQITHGDSYSYCLRYGIVRSKKLIK